MLLKGLAEARAAPVPIKAADMVLIRLAYTATLPTPAEVLGRPAGPASAAEGSGSGAPRAFTGGRAPAPRSPLASTAAAALPASSPRAFDPDQPRVPPTAAQPPVPTPLPTPLPATFDQVIALAESEREMLLHGHLLGSVRLVRFEVGHLELALEQDAPAELPQRLSRFLSQRTGRPWLVTLSAEGGAPSVLAQRRQEAADLRERVAATPLIAAVFEAFPGATIDSIRRLDPTDAGLDVGDPGTGESPTDDVAGDDAAAEALEDDGED
jgi:DNA polymerase-3 subunit gamma/tau